MDEFKQIKNLKYYKGLAYLIAITRCLIPGLVRKHQGKNFWGNNIPEVICIVLLMINTIHVYSICFINMLGGIYDLQLKNYI